MKTLAKFFKTTLQRTKETVRLFPVSMVLIASAFSLMVFNTWSSQDYIMDEFLVRINVIAWVILPVFTAFTLFFKRKECLLLGVAAAVGLFFMTKDGLPEYDIRLLVLWGFAFYSLIFLLPFWKKNQNNGFWTYCARIFFVLVLGFVCSGILALSLQLALESIRSLFEVNVDYRWNETLMFFSFFFVLPVFVHVGLPQDWQSLDKNTNYPDFFRPLSYYLLTPISVLFFGILGTYMLKILFTWEWPSGQVAYPVLYLTFVTFAFYLISYPWRQHWQRFFFIALLPFLAMYFAALGMRIEQYGLTELRYMGVVLGICLSLMAVYFAFVNRQRLQMMLLPLALCAFVFAVGPWSFAEVPVRNQMARLEMMLTEIGALQDGKLVKVDAAAVSEEQLISISSSVDYLYQEDRLHELQDWTTVALDDDGVHGYPPEDFMAQLGLRFQPYVVSFHEGLYFDYGVKYMSTLNTTGYDYLVDFDIGSEPYFSDPPRAFSFETEGVTLTMTATQEGILTISNGRTQIDFDLLAFEKGNQNAPIKYEMDAANMMLQAENKDMDIRLYVNSMNGTYTDDAQTAFDHFTVWGKMLVSLR